MELSPHLCNAVAVNGRQCSRRIMIGTLCTQHHACLQMGTVILYADTARRADTGTGDVAVQTRTHQPFTAERRSNTSRHVPYGLHTSDSSRPGGSGQPNAATAQRVPREHAVPSPSGTDSFDGGEINMAIQLSLDALSARPALPSSALGSPPSGDTCCVCLDSPCEVQTLPCRHIHLCTACALTLDRDRGPCPICRAPVQSLVQVRFAESPAPSFQVAALLPAPQPIQGAAATGSRASQSHSGHSGETRRANASWHEYNDGHGGREQGELVLEPQLVARTPLDPRPQEARPIWGAHSSETNPARQNDDIYFHRTTPIVQHSSSSRWFAHEALEQLRHSVVVFIIWVGYAQLMWEVALAVLWVGGRRICLEMSWDTAFKGLGCVLSETFIPLLLASWLVGTVAVFVDFAMA